MDKDVLLTRYPMDWGTSSQHVGLEKLVNLLLAGIRLMDSEHAHLMRCSECTYAMVKAAGARLRSPSKFVQ